MQSKTIFSIKANNGLFYDLFKWYYSMLLAILFTYILECV